jgi:hypothetical protein
MARKKGITTLVEANESRGNAIKYGELAKRNFKDLTPHRINQNTVILIRSDKDKADQINRFIAKLERDRKNY